MNVIYTAIAENRDKLKPHPRIRGCRFIAFLDRPEKSSNRDWEMLKLEPFHQDPTRNSKRYKVMAHEVLPQAEYSLWIDGSVEIKRGFSLNRLIEKFLPKHDIAMFRHCRRHCIYQEARKCKNGKFDDPSTIDQQMSRYRSEGYPENHGLTENRIILRRHTPTIALLNTTWWREICGGSRRDQLSFNYALWKTGITCSMLPGTNWNNPFFRIHKHLHSLPPFQSSP